MDDHPNFGHFLRIDIFPIGVVKGSFKQHWSHLFPKLPDPSQFVRQTANLWVVKQQLLGADTADIHLVDGFPMDVCVTTRAKNSTVYKGEAAYSYCTAKKKSFYGFQSNEDTSSYKNSHKSTGRLF